MNTGDPHEETVSSRMLIIDAAPRSDYRHTLERREEIAMIGSSLSRVPFMPVLPLLGWENSHSRRSSFRGLRQTDRRTSSIL